METSPLGWKRPRGCHPVAPPRRIESARLAIKRSSAALAGNLCRRASNRMRAIGDEQDPGSRLVATRISSAASLRRPVRIARACANPNRAGYLRHATQGQVRGQPARKLRTAVDRLADTLRAGEVLAPAAVRESGVPRRAGLSGSYATCSSSVEQPSRLTALPTRRAVVTAGSRLKEQRAHGAQRDCSVTDGAVRPGRRRMLASRPFRSSGRAAVGLTHTQTKRRSHGSGA